MAKYTREMLTFQSDAWEKAVDILIDTYRKFFEAFALAAKVFMESIYELLKGLASLAKINVLPMEKEKKISSRTSLYTGPEPPIRARRRYQSRSR